MIEKIVDEINMMELGIKADFGYSNTADKGIFVTETILKDTSKHTRGGRIQVLICITDSQDGYLECKDMAEKIRTKLEELNCYNITESYVGEYNNKHSYSINLSTGGI